MPDNAVRDPREVFELLLKSLADRDLTTAAGLYADDAVVRQPFAKPAEVVLTGRPEIEQHFAVFGAAPITLSPQNIEVHETTDPQVVVGEWDNTVTRTTDGTTVTTHNIAVFCVRDGRVVWSRDYHDHAALAGLLS
ncbi:nuclear transport factor 2 family protein [Streptomyces sp. NPDC057620]|uniref:Nuclear transport factor 2 family protein n=1 Tax=Streptomyces liliiviolaceus TaxID=2823109 RepID=A0A940Y7S3_9ACTN|nr:nuclear transport factor 2 family protein [Streptomyces liliiviolaceus]MBQ0854766.1 nuclear transport factor 2 family protein [Streptomyces liliiviolaceus]